MSTKMTAPLKLSPVETLRRAAALLFKDHSRVRLRIGGAVTYLKSADELPASIPFDETVELTASRHITLLADGVITEEEADALDPVEVVYAEDVVGAPD